MTQAYTVQQAAFSGPLDVLLDLIEKKKLSINDVSLSQVSDEYLSYVKEHDISKTQMAHFLVVAATLMLIKSTTLLPGMTLTKEEEESIEELEMRLARYKKIRNLTKGLEERYNKNRTFPGGLKRDIVPRFLPDPRLTVSFIGSLARELTSAFPEIKKLPEAAIQKVVSLEEMIENLATRIKEKMSFTFSSVTGYGKEKVVPKEKRIEMIVGFLAILELVKQELLHAAQQSPHADITLSDQTTK